MGRRRGDAARQGDLGEGRQQRIYLRDEDLHADRGEARSGLKKIIVPASLGQEKGAD
jgi:hypothetical protein